jgi:peptidoglycan/LPS O-acetylase OafA/YrhL
MGRPHGMAENKRAKRLRLVDQVLSRLSRVTSSGNFIPEIDGLRFFAIAAVVLFHIAEHVRFHGPVHYAEAPRSSIYRLCSGGFVGVELFFTISGFILFLPYAAHFLRGGKRPRLRQYYFRRVSRIEPPYLIHLGIAFVIALVIDNHDPLQLAPHLMASAFYLHNLIYGMSSTLNTVAWSLEIEVQFYLLAPLLAGLYRIRRSHQRRLAWLALTMSAMAWQPCLSSPFHCSLLAYLPYFLVGFLLADLFITAWNRPPTTTWKQDLMATGAWLLLIPATELVAWRQWILPPLILLAYVGAFRGRYWRQIVSNRWLVVTGGMCYTIYLYHVFIIGLVGRVASRVMVTQLYWANFLLFLIPSTIAVLAVCAILFLLFEKPFMYRDWPQTWRAAVLSRLAPRGVRG